MNKISVDRRVSKIADLDKDRVRELCELHPWDLGRLSADVGMARTAISHFFSGRRPFPMKYAPKFLRQLGLTLKGEPDGNHCFCFSVGAGMEDVAVAWLKRLFPNGGKKIDLTNTGSDYDRPQLPSNQWLYGFALKSDTHVALIRDEIHFGSSDWLPGLWETLDCIDMADDLLAMEKLPTKLEIMNLMNAVPDYDNYLWGVIRSKATELGLSVDDVHAILKSTVPGWTEPVLMEDGKAII